MKRFGQCAIDKLGDPNDPTMMTDIDWLSCDRCGNCFHSVCIGFCKEYFEHLRSPFIRQYLKVTLSVLISGG